MQLIDSVKKLSWLIVITLMVNQSEGQVLYMQDFDVDDTANWNENLSPDTDSDADFFFDYSAVGVPSAPNSTGGSTRGLKLQANLFGGMFGGLSVSPTGQSFTGDYVLSYDMWQNYQAVDFIPPENEFPAGGGIIRGQASGTTNIAYGGIMTSGTTPNSAGVADGVWFAATPDGDSGADYRAYSSDRAVSYQFPPDEPNDSDATYFAESRNHTADLYVNSFPAQAPTAAQAVLDPDGYELAPENMTDAGVLGFAWHEHTVTKIGDLVTWAVDGVDLISVDTSNFAIPVGGENILFGYGDVNNGSSQNLNAETFLFALVDNVKVEVATVSALPGDFNGDDIVDAADYTVFQDNLGATEDGSVLNGNGDGGSVGPSDYQLWVDNFGMTAAGAGLGSASIPEPSSLALIAISLACVLGYRRP